MVRARPIAAIAPGRSPRNISGLFPGFAGFFPYCGREDEIIAEHPDVEQPPPGEEVFFTKTAHGPVVDEALDEEADAEQDEAYAPVIEQADDQQGIEQQVGEGIEAEQE